MKERSMVPKARPHRSYYGRPVIKPPVWKAEVPWYFFAGGLTGASAALSLAAEAAGNRTLAHRSWGVALLAGTASPPLLILDLGRPERFLHMLRVFKPTSPMSMGSWILSATGGAVAVATLSDRLGAPAGLRRAARTAAAVFGLPLSTYTGALLANTAVPVWHEGRGELPFVFAGSAAASAGAAAIVVTPSARAGPARRLVVAGAVLETGAAMLMEHRLGELAEPYRSGRAGLYARLSRASTAAGSALVALRGRVRPVAVAGGALVLAGSALERWAVFEAGVQSAKDPRYTITPQRRRLAERGDEGHEPYVTAVGGGDGAR